MSRASEKRQGLQQNRTVQSEIDFCPIPKPTLDTSPRICCQFEARSNKTARSRHILCRSAGSCLPTLAEARPSWARQSTYETCQNQRIQRAGSEVSQFASQYLRTIESYMFRSSKVLAPQFCSLQPNSKVRDPKSPVSLDPSHLGCSI